jgi:hypothetical protein
MQVGILTICELTTSLALYLFYFPHHQSIVKLTRKNFKTNKKNPQDDYEWNKTWRMARNVNFAIFREKNPHKTADKYRQFIAQSKLHSAFSTNTTSSFSSLLLVRCLRFWRLLLYLKIHYITFQKIPYKETFYTSFMTLILTNYSQMHNKYLCQLLDFLLLSNFIFGSSKHIFNSLVLLLLYV